MLSAAPAAMPVAASNDLQSASRWSYYLSYHNATQTLAVGNVVYTLFNGNLLAYDAAEQLRNRQTVVWPGAQGH